MRNVILQEFVSLDGMAADVNNGVDFVPASVQGDQKFGQRQEVFIDSIDAILLGRVTYNMFSAYWPNVTSGDDKPFADKLNVIPKIVFSQTLDRAPWGDYEPARIVKTDATGEVVALKQQAGKDMVVWGSISLAQSLVQAGLIDQYQLIVCPLVLGNGQALFGDSTPFNLKLEKAQSFDRGAVLLDYRAAPTRK
jgi:dihydrofolate reductase